MRAGDLNCLVSIRAHDGTQGTDGQPVPGAFTQITEGECWAKIAGLMGREALKADKDTAVGQFTITVRYRTDVTAAMRVYHGTDVYEIKTVLPSKRSRKYVELVCEQLSGN